MASSSNPLYANQQVAVADLHYVAPPTVAMADDHYLRGVQAVKGHDYLTALHHFTKATFLAPQEPLPFVARAEAYTHLCDLKSAISSYRKAVSLMKDPVAVQDLKARLAQVLDAQGLSAFREGQYRQALRFAEESLREHYHSAAELHKVLYLVALREHHLAETILTSSLLQRPEVKADAAVVLVEMTINLRQDFATAKALLESVLSDFGRHPRVLNAERFFDESFIEYKKSAEDTMDIEKLTKCVAAFPEDASLYQLRAAAYTSQKMYTAAVQDLFASITKSGGTNPSSVKMMTDILFTIASELALVSDYTSAINYFSEALKWSEHNLDALLARGDCHLALGHHEDALKDYKAVVVHDSLHSGAKQRLARLHDVWGVLLYNQAKYELAEAEFSKAILHWDEDPEIFFHRAQCRLMMKQPEFAVRDLLSCRELHPTDPEIMKLVLQFCPPALSTAVAQVCAPTETPCARRPTSARLHGTAPMSDTRTQREARMVAIAKHDPQAVLEAPNVKHSVAILSHASASLCTKSSTLEEKFNPLALREYVKMTRTAASKSSIVGTTNPLLLGQGQLGIKAVAEKPNNGSTSARDGEKKATDNVRRTPTSGDTCWSSATKKGLSRLDRTEVSKEQPIPKKYTTQRLVATSASTNGGRSSLDSVLDVSVPGVPPPSHPARGGPIGPSTAASLSASTPSQFLFSSKAAISVKTPTFDSGKETSTAKPQRGLRH